MTRPTRVPAGQIVATDLSAASAVVQIEVRICADAADGASGFSVTDDIGSGSLAEPGADCRTATAGEVTVRADALTPDGLTATSSTASSDNLGVISLSIPTGDGSMAVRLTAISPGSDATTSVPLSPGQTRSLTLIVPTPASAVTDMTTDLVMEQGAGWTALAASGPEQVSASSSSWIGWFAVAGLLLAALAVAFPSLRRVRRS